MRTIKTKQADDGTELQIKKRGDNEYIVTEKGSSGRTGEVVRSRQAAERQLNETSRLYGRADESRSQPDPTGMGGGLFGGGGGMDSDMDADTSDPGLFGAGGGMDMGGADDEMGSGLFGGGGGDTSDNSDSGDGGGLFGGGGGGLFGGGGSSRVRDPDSGKFAPKRRESVDFQMERDSQGRFKGREETGGDDGDGLLDRFL